MAVEGLDSEFVAVGMRTAAVIEVVAAVSVAAAVV